MQATRSLVLAILPAVMAMATWKNSTVGIHAFLTFDAEAMDPDITKYADRIDYVWGTSEDKVAVWRASPNPDVILSKYIPYCRDPQPHVTPVPGTTGSGLPWWQKNKPSLVMYQCDRKTPAWECFSGEGCAHVSVPIDLTNPETLEYQMEVGVLPAKARGYNAIAFDNYGLINQWKACGSFSGPGGTWKQQYNPEDPAADPQYTQDVLNWTARVVEQIHREGMLVIPNFSEMNLKDSNVLAVMNLTDGMLAEGGFTMWDPVPNTSSAHTAPPMTTPDKFELQVNFVRNLQKHGKGFFAINEWGAGPDYHLNPSKIPYNITGPHNRAIRQFVTAAFMMVNGHSAGIYLTCIQCYGGNAGGLGNLSIWPEYSAPVGFPVAEPEKDAQTGVWSRLYSAAIALVNPAPTVQHASLPSGNWQDLYGGVPIGHIVELPAASGLVLLKVA